MGRFAWFKRAFSMDGHAAPLTDDEIALLVRIADFVVKRRMTTPALLVLETGKPMNYLGSQAMAFFEPVVKMLFSTGEYQRLAKIMERRHSVDHLMQLIEAREAAHQSGGAAGAQQDNS